ncbi:MAG: tetratricopeptide repeat protein [Melioribacteraceae bacterium]|nr:MAG: tetratricopeptide repeat protein [Melioribacteraceae bacterium]
MSLVWAITQGLNIRRKAKVEQATEHTLEVHAFLAAVSVVIVPLLSLSPFHLLWMLPVSFFLGLSSIIFPLNLLWYPASLYSYLWYYGVKNPGRAFYLNGDYENAIKHFKAQLHSNPNSAETFFNLGLAYDKAGDTNNAIESYKNAVQIRPDSEITYLNLGLAYKDSGDYQNAIESFKEAIKIKPTYYKARVNLGLVFLELGDIEGAMKEYVILKKSDSSIAAELYSEIEKLNK